MHAVKIRLRALLALLCVVASWGAPAFAVTEQASDASPVLEKPTALSPAAWQLAEQLGIANRIQKLDEHRRLSTPESLEVTQNKQAIMQAVLVAMLQVRAASAQISYDIFEAGQTRTLLEGRRDKVIKYNSIANFMSGGVAEVTGGSMQLAPNIQQLDTAGNIVEIVGGVAQTALSVMALRQQQGQKRRQPLRPNMLAPIFDQTTNHESKYPSVVWKYLNSSPSNGDSRRVALVKQWLESGRLPGREAPRIAALTGNGGQRYPVTIDILEDRQAMLSDVNAMISTIERQLLEILLYSDLQNSGE